MPDIKAHDAADQLICIAFVEHLGTNLRLTGALTGGAAAGVTPHWTVGVQ